MIKVIKIGDTIYENIEPKYTDVNGKEHWIIPQDSATLKNYIIGTLGWIVYKKINKILNGVNLRDAANSKTIVLLAKLISTLNPDTSKLTKNEQTIYNNLLTLSTDGYSDSKLVISSTQQLIEAMEWYKTEIDKVNVLSTFDEMVDYLESL